MSACPSPDIRRCALVIATLTSFLPPFMASSINIALPAIGDEFSMDAILLSWIATSYLLSAAVFMVPFGKVADIYGMKKVFFIGLFIFTASSLVAFFAPTSMINAIQPINFMPCQSCFNKRKIKTRQQVGVGFS